MEREDKHKLLHYIASQPSDYTEKALELLLDYIEELSDRIETLEKDMGIEVDAEIENKPPEGPKNPEGVGPRHPDYIPGGGFKFRTSKK